MLWENYKPTYLSDIKTNLFMVRGLQRLITKYQKTKEFLNMIVYGTEESGKTTLVRCMLASMFGGDIYKTTPIVHNVRQNCSNYTVNIYRSNHHYEISFAGLQYADRCVMTSVLDEYFNTANVLDNVFKILVIRDFHILTKPAQYALRRRMETHYQAVRFILVTSCINKVEPAIISRCVGIRCPRPTPSEVRIQLKDICNKSSIRISDETIDDIVNKSDRNIGKSLYYLEIIKNTDKTDIICPSHECINRLLSCFQEKSYPCQRVREAISDLQLAKISSCVIFRKLLAWVTDNIDNPRHACQSIECIAKYELISSKYNRFSIAMETTMVTLFNIYSKDA